MGGGVESGLKPQTGAENISSRKVWNFVGCAPCHIPTDVPKTVPGTQSATME